LTEDIEFRFASRQAPEQAAADFPHRLEGKA
jgi:hypothetical protein